MQPLCYKQSQLLRKSFRETSFFPQIHMKNTLIVKTTASPITTTRRVFYPLVNVLLYYLEKLKSCYINLIYFVSYINTWSVYIPCWSTNSGEKLLQKSANVFGNEQRAICFNQRNRGVDTKLRVLKKRGSLEKNINSVFVSALQKNKPTQTSGSVSAGRIEKAKGLNLTGN